MLAMVGRQQILTAGMAYSIEFQQVVEAVQPGIPAEAQRHSERAHSIEKALRREKKELTRLHRASMKKHLLLLHSAHEKLFHLEDGSEHARLQHGEKFHLVKKSEPFPLIACQIAVGLQRRSSSQGLRLHRLKTRL